MSLENQKVSDLSEYIYHPERIKRLAEIYQQSTHDAAIVAKICDDVIDRSGRLLGEVRKVVRGQ